MRNLREVKLIKVVCETHALEAGRDIMAHRTMHMSAAPIARSDRALLPDSYESSEIIQGVRETKTHAYRLYGAKEPTYINCSPELEDILVRPLEQWTKYIDHISEELVASNRKNIKLALENVDIRKSRQAMRKLTGEYHNTIAKYKKANIFQRIKYLFTGEL